jgi:hypothetical protein
MGETPGRTSVIPCHITFVGVQIGPEINSHVPRVLLAVSHHREMHLCDFVGYGLLVQENATLVLLPTRPSPHLTRRGGLPRRSPGVKTRWRCQIQACWHKRNLRSQCRFQSKDGGRAGGAERRVDAEATLRSRNEDLSFR